MGKNNKEKTNDKKKHTLRNVTIAIVVIVLTSGIVTGALFYGFAYLRCGHAPVMVKSNPGFGARGDNGYEMPGDVGYFPGLFDTYYCSTEEAEAEGFQPSPLSKEGLRRGEAESENLRKESQ